MLHDPRPIKSVEWAGGDCCHTVGQGGVTEIVCYEEPGQMTTLPWLAVYKGDLLWIRLDAAGKEIQYA